MTSSSPALLQLAQRLRELREQQWPDVRLTQAQLAKALGNVAPATVSSWESTAAPKLPPAERLSAYARFFATRRSADGEPPALLPREDLSEDELAACQGLEEELLALREEARAPAQRYEVPARKSWHFTDAGPLTIVCAQLPPDKTGSFADPADPNYTELQSFADLDALIELHGHVRSQNPGMEVFFKASPKVDPDDLTGHLVLLGGIIWNPSHAAAVRNDLAAGPANHRSRSSPPVTYLRPTLMATKRRFMPEWYDEPEKNLREDVGLLARAPNPLNSNRALIICNGVHSRGVLGAVRSLTDAKLRDSNEKYIARNFSRSGLICHPDARTHHRRAGHDAGFQRPGSVLYKWP